MVFKKLSVPKLLVERVKSFHEDMDARIRIDQQLLKEIEVNNGLRQGCTMAPTLFNLYACVVTELWLKKGHGIEEVGNLHSV